MFNENIKCSTFQFSLRSAQTNSRRVYWALKLCVCVYQINSLSLSFAFFRRTFSSSHSKIPSANALEAPAQKKKSSSASVARPSPLCYSSKAHNIVVASSVALTFAGEEEERRPTLDALRFVVRPP